ncbi:MAG TPA: hypothetical protein VGJ44_03125 [Kribbellaceae bacterium]
MTAGASTLRELGRDSVAYGIVAGLLAGIGSTVALLIAQLAFARRRRTSYDARGG